jgi:hypothetical protein
MIKVINNQKVDMTNDEWNMYQNIVNSYTTLTNKGEDYFDDLFHSNDDGIIIFLKPPSHRQTSMEIFCFLMSLMQHQQLRLMHRQVNDIVNQMTEKMHELDEKLQKLSEGKKDK